MAQVTAEIVIAQAGNPAPGGYVSGSRDDIVVGSAITATNRDDASVTWHRWTVTPYYPAGTLVGLGVTGDGSPTCGFEPDVEGDISLTLETSGAPLPGGGANYARTTITLGIRAVLAGYAAGLPLPHPLEAGRGQSGAVDAAVGANGRIAESIYALKVGLSKAGAGTPYASTPAAVASSGKSGASGDYARGDHVHAGVATIAATGKAGITGAATMSAGKGIALTQVSNDIEIALSGSSGGPPAALVWDTTQATDATKGRYATMAEIATAIGTAESPVEVDVVGAALANAAGTYEWANVHFRTSKAGTTLVGSEGVVIRNASFSGPLQISSNATSTRFLTYTADRVARFDGPTLTGSATKGLITTNNAGAQVFRFSGGATLNARTFEQTVAAAAEFHTDDVTYAGSNQFLGSLGTLEFLKTANTVGAPELSSWSGATPDYGFSPYVGAISPDTDADHVYVFDLAEPPGATGFGNAGTGPALTFTQGGYGGNDPLFGVPTPIGGRCYFDDDSFFYASDAMTSPITDQFTIEFWLEYRKNPALIAGSVAILHWENSGSYGPCRVYLDTDYVYVALETAGSAPADVTVGAPIYGFGRHHYVCTYDGADIKLYVDGVERGSQTSSGDLAIGGGGWTIGNGSDGQYVLGNVRVSQIARDLAYAKSMFEAGAYNGAFGTVNATAIQGVPVDPAAPTAGQALVYDGAAWTPTAQPTRGVVASLEWTAAAGVYTQVSAENIAGVAGYDYGSGTLSLKVTLTNAVTNGVGISQSDPDWVGAFHVDSAGPVMISGTEVRIDFRDKADTQVSPANGAGVFTLIGDL